MMRSLFSGVSGLKTHQTKMDVIGNNIANVNTTGYKASSITFSALMSQTTQKASGANAATGTGGTNARQIGLGVKAGAININITGQGASQSTGNPFDVMINGENFFVVSDGSQNYFTRDGSFYVDGAGNLAMTSIGYNVMGWQVDPETGNIKKDTVSALRIMSAANMTYPPEATTQGYMSGILDKNDTDVTSTNGKTVNFQFYDSLGYSYTAKFIFRQSDDRKVYGLELDKIIDSEGKEVPFTDKQGNPVNVFGDTKLLEKDGTLQFNTNNYEWASATLLRNKNTGEEIDLAALIDGGDWRDMDEMIGPAGAQVRVGDQLNKIAAAYGYEGRTEDFLNLAYLVTPGNPTETPPTQDVTCTIENILLGQAPAGVTGMPTINNACVVNPADATDPIYTAQLKGSMFTGVTVSFDGKNGDFAGIDGNPAQSTIKLALSGIGEGNFADITIDMSAIGNQDNKGTSTVGATNGSNDDATLGQGAGRRLGDMIGVSIQPNGMIYASYDNGMTKLLGQIATARFANASGLEKQADNLYSSTLNSGEFDGIGVDITANGDSMSTGQLEMSNVDLSSEFTEMITTQRGFQANSRIITVSDTLLEELTNLKR